MPPDTAATIQAWMSVAQTIVIIISALFAVREAKRWRKPLVGTKHIDLAYELFEAAFEVRQQVLFYRSYIATEKDLGRQVDETDNHRDAVNVALLKLKTTIEKVRFAFDKDFQSEVNVIVDLVGELGVLRTKIQQNEPLEALESDILIGILEEDDKDLFFKRLKIPLHKMSDFGKPLVRESMLKAIS
jgi:hypothetical protein